ncbi:TetR/AcrR family transcriptional regulator [Thermostaphylospora chromogena]|uniref:DNA-binding transcriptional regulator, AcrR family n=1 Tax=Thermostaphylospora chromogena TaxID=35622 RepID=A0A1H1BIU9_9ACTN|nr:TetR/AcrR family transcriptional regulator [Thermostaphylospora chromogena]SDQ51878.1 DNA-binding transcriptional regulator, AcrR family [Thermostaphylospora chromogena]
MTPGKSREGGRRGRPGYDRDSLLEVAVAVFNERGYDGTGMEELSRRLGITKSAIYHHVSGKEELLDLAVSRALDALFAVLDEEQDAPGGATARLERTVRRAVKVLVRELPYVTLLLRVHGNSEAEKRALARRREFDHRVAELVARAAAEGGIRPDLDPRLASRLMFGTVNSLIEWYRPGGDLSGDALADAVTTFIFDGLRAAAPPDAGG